MGKADPATRLLVLAALLMAASLADAADLEAGKAKVAAVCAACHGATGGGDGPVAATLSVRPPALRDLAIQGRSSDQELVDLTLYGRAGTPMPGFARALDREAAEKLVAFLRVLPTAERQRYQASPAGAAFSANGGDAVRLGPISPGLRARRRGTIT